MKTTGNCRRCGKLTSYYDGDKLGDSWLCLPCTGVKKDLWENESGFLTEAAKQIVEQRDSAPDDVLITIWRELDAITRLLINAIWWSGKRTQAVRRVALASGINYGQTPINQFGYIPSPELCIHLSCMLWEDAKEAAKLNSRPAQKPERVTAADLADFD